MAGEDEFEVISQRIADVPEAHLTEFKDAFQRLGGEGCKQYLEAKGIEWRTVPLNIGVIGGSGIGKSSFINSIRRINGDDPGSATVDAVECTMTIAKYQHPNNPLLQFWDLPGVGTPNFPQEEYLDKIGVDDFDFFLILSASRFTNTDVWLSREIAARRRNFLFVRTKIHADVESHKKNKPKTHDVDALLGKIRDDIKKNLEKDVPFFLIDSYETTLYDFDDLEVQLLLDFPALKREALYQSIGTHSEKMIRAKVKILQDDIWRVCALSGATTLLPLPLLAFACDRAIVLHQGAKYMKQLGLDDDSLKKTADSCRCDYESLRRIRTAKCVDGTVSGYLKEIGAVVLVALNDAISRKLILSTESLVGGAVAEPHSFREMRATLQRLLSDMEQVALEVIDVAVKKSATSAAQQTAAWY